MRTIFTLFTLLLLPALGWAQAPPAIHQAVNRGDVDAVAAILEKDESQLNVPDRLGLTPVNLAAFRNKIEVLEELIRWGADLNLGDHEGSLPLHNAAAGGAFEAVEYLLGEGVDLNVQDNNGMTALHFAVDRRKVQVAEFLIEIGAELELKSTERGFTPLAYAAQRGSLHLATLLVEAGADVDTRDRGDRTPLHHGNVEIAKMLLANGADLHAADGGGRNALFTAAFGSPEYPRFLLEQGLEIGGDPSGKERSDSALHFSILGGDPQTITLFLEAGAPLEARDRNGLTPLQLAVSRGVAAAVDVLLERGAAIDATIPGFERTVLHLAAASGQTEVVRTLLEGGADRSAGDSRGKTALALAADYGHAEVAALLAGEKKAPKVCTAASLLGAKIEPGQAQVIHLAHSGWAIRTANHFLVFDWFDQNNGVVPPGASLVNGNITPAELKDEKVIVFATHEHGDHYDARIFDWAREIPDITYVLGLDPGETPREYTYLPPRTVKKIGDLKITTIAANDSGVGFLVEVDGLAIMHAGDHANRTTERGEEHAIYTREIDFIASQKVDIDLAFYPISGCGFGNPEAVAMGVNYATKMLHPKILVPMHAGDSFYLYPEFGRRFPDPTGHTKTVAVANRGDRFFYGGGAVKQ